MYPSTVSAWKRRKTCKFSRPLCDQLPDVYSCDFVRVAVQCFLVQQQTSFQLCSTNIKVTQGEIFSVCSCRYIKLGHKKTLKVFAELLGLSNLWRDVKVRNLFFFSSRNSTFFRLFLSYWEFFYLCLAYIPHCYIVTTVIIVAGKNTDNNFEVHFLLLKGL